MHKLCSCSFYPTYGNRDFVLDAMTQIIFSETGIIPVYEGNDRFSLNYYATSYQEYLVQSKVNFHLPRIMHIIHNDRAAIWQYLFDHALYVAGNKTYYQHGHYQTA